MFASKSVRILQPQQSRAAAPHSAGTPQGFSHVPGLHLSPPFYQCCGSGFFFKSRIQGQKLFLRSRKYDPGFSTRILDHGSWFFFLPIPDPGSRGQKGTGSATLPLILLGGRSCLKHHLWNSVLHPDIRNQKWRAWICFFGGPDYLPSLV